MSVFKWFLFFIIVSTNLSAQTLFEDSTVAQPVISNTVSPSVEPQVTTSLITPTIKKTNETVKRFIGTNVESVIVRGDIQVQYEVPQSNDWSTIAFLHVNPQENFNNKTGDLGAYFGGRMYLDGANVKGPIYLQALFGFNHFSSWDLALSFDVGKQIQWKKNVFFEFSANVSRYYAKTMPDPEVSVKVGLTYGLDTRLLPFL
jgi:hypothetical protein